MVQPCSPALPPGPSVPQLAGWSLPSDAAARDAAEANCNERSAGTAYQGEAPNLPQPATVMTAVRSQPHARLRNHRSGNHQRICSTAA
ncbi:xanthomonadin biosynthesis related protein 1 [Xanthomonas campestris pv. campestris str. 8004]|uniref:Xanthomonadin biosynthesis related protein 1 n=2 Tax=Xanthomonas campestris pv. campestris TaxID=340 RepID=Q8PDJ9_XANCP|nr:xanthomonadin biosynthesis related protein 1 [Xanthomonas campestris pv. campestris str. ATCC 33913]AAY47433.1 xanthomonadin biosynthesis related protein 1 [Xanthomonas campestris pv. campestris str. 8004]AKS18155.1 xanthomonadin biosynthesis protein [Xanthomonas campestris pv. campestris]AKS22167.1 xanthomonadin biosynthesis protein [Xanthomonas campestris pv. campestris]ALE70732.1 xanthomonadin biosynthesis protein [Xanthomonas campestris pv. campestris]